MNETTGSTLFEDSVVIAANLSATSTALRDHFQAERDTKLGRWRDPDNPDYVAYRSPEDDDDEGRCILLLNETTGETIYEWERLSYSRPARRYFETHPQPEPRPTFAAYVDKNGSAVWVTDENGNLRCLSDQNLDPEKYAPFTRLLPDE